ncbi:MAG: outer membrane protein transport protein [Candidatus Omnitrophica bacterium]|nr:outer membrane protein transport protein [Candidatus Omnitrophota bacterium]
MNRQRRVPNFSVLAIWAFAAALAFPPSLFAVGSAGFENASYSARSLSQANAVVARPQDASTISFNPAGIGELEGIQLTGGLQGLSWNIFHQNAVTGDHNQNNTKLVLLPSFYLTLNPGDLLDDRLAFGVGVNSPFGLRSSFPAVSVGRYPGYKNYLEVVATTIAGSLKVNDKISIGGGATNYYVYKYGQRINYPNSFILGPFGAGAPDGVAFTEMNGYGWGWNAGALLKPFEHHRLAVSYRSNANIKTHGKAVVEGLVLGGVQGYDTFPTFETGIHSDLSIPGNLTFGYAYLPSDKWSAETDIGLTFWNVFNDQDIEFDRPNAVLRSLGTIPRDYDMTWNFHFGGEYHLSKKTDLMGGFFFYQAASPKKHVDNFLPDANRFGWTLGTGHKFGKNASLDFNYIFILFARRDISNPEQAAKSGESIDGKYQSIIHGPMITFTYRFDFPFSGKEEAEPKLEAPKPILREFK